MKILEQIQNAVSSFSPNLLGALLVLIIGVIGALILSAIARGVLRRTQFDNKLARWMSGPENRGQVPVETWVGKAVFWFAMLFVLVAFFHTLKLPIISEPLNNILKKVTDFLPQVLGAAVLSVLAWLLATVLRRVVAMGLQTFKFDQRVGDAAESKTPLSKTLSDAVYWLVFLVFLPAILGTLGMTALLEPVNQMFNKGFAYLPQLFGAGVTLLIGWFVARIVQRLVSSLLAAAGLDSLGDRWGVNKTLGKMKLSALVGTLLHYFILLPVVISALNTLGLDAITRPASDMLAKILNMLPSIFGATLVLALAFLIGRVVSGLVTNILAGLGFNNVLVKLGLAREAFAGERAPAGLAGRLVLMVIMAFASMEAAKLLGFPQVAAIIEDFVRFGGHVLMGCLIFGLGLLLSNWVVSVIRASKSENAALLSAGARVVILLLAGAMALRQMELANSIVNTAFSLVLGAVAVAVALAFGLGGRESAARMMNDWFRKT